MSTIAPKVEQAPPPPKVILPEGKAAPRLGGSQKPLVRGFMSNLRDFLMERPVKVGKNVRGDVFTVEEYGDGVTENLKEWFKPTPKAVSSRMTVAWQSPYKVMWQNIRDLISPPKLPPLKVTSQPVQVKDIWSKDKAFGPSQAIALAVHIGITVLIFSPLLYSVVTKATGNPKANSWSRRLTFPTIRQAAPRQRQSWRRRWAAGKSTSRNGEQSSEIQLQSNAPPMVHKTDSSFQATLLGPPDHNPQPGYG